MIDNHAWTWHQSACSLILTFSINIAHCSGQATCVIVFATGYRLTCVIEQLVNIKLDLLQTLWSTFSDFCIQLHILFWLMRIIVTHHLCRFRKRALDVLFSNGTLLRNSGNCRSYTDTACFVTARYNVWEKHLSPTNFSSTAKKRVCRELVLHLL